LLRSGLLRGRGSQQLQPDSVNVGLEVWGVVLRILMLGVEDRIASSIHVSRKAREKLSRTGFMMYSKNVRSPVVM
jgi:hypothetical protein